MRISDWSSDVCSSDLAIPCGDRSGSVRECLGGPVTGERGRAEDQQRARVVRTVQEQTRGDFTRSVGVAGPECGLGFLDECIAGGRSEEHTSELQSLMRISYAVFCLKKKKKYKNEHISASS